MAEGGVDPKELRIRGLSILRSAMRSLMELAASGDTHLAEPSVVALGKIGDPAAIPLLAGLFDDDQVAKEAVTAINAIEEPSVVDLVLEGSRRSTPKMMATCAEALEPWVTRAPKVVDRLEELVTNTFAPIRVAALRSIGVAPRERVRPILIKALQDDDPEVVVVALKSLLAVGVVPDDLAFLEEFFSQAQVPKVRATVVDLFGLFPDKTSLGVLKKALRDPNPRVRANAVEAVHGLKGLGDRRRVALLSPLFQEGENNRVLANVAMALGEADPPTSVQILSKLLNSTEKWERASAVYAARFVRNDRVASWLTVQLTSEDDSDVLRNVLSSLEFFEGEEVTQCFLRALDHSNPLVRSGAARALGGTQDVDVEAALISLLDTEKEQSVLCEVIRSLGRMCDSSRISLLAQQLQHTDLRVQATAIEALATIGTVEIVPHVEPFLNSTDNRVKANAAVSMWNTGNLSVVHDLKSMLASPSLKQRSSAVYAIGELGESLRHLEAVDRYFLLVSALKQEAPVEDSALEIATASWGSRSLDIEKQPGVVVPGAAPAGAIAPPATQDYPFEVIESFFERLEARDARGALEILEGALTKKPEDPYLNYLRGDVHRRQRELGKACEDFTKVGAAAPDFLNAQLFLANIYQESRELPQSLDAYFRAVMAELGVLQEYAAAGLELLEKKKTNEASLLLKDLIQRVPLDHKSHHKAGLDFLRYKVYDRALEQLIRAYTTRPASGELKVGLAYAFFKRKQYSRARRLCELVTTRHGEDATLMSKARSLLGVMDKAGV
jgi:HEAT repeat protein/Tfp pilus assembly protein PilF